MDDLLVVFADHANRGLINFTEPLNSTSVAVTIHKRRVSMERGTI